MKILAYLICLSLLLQNKLNAQNIGIGTTTPHINAILDLNSSTKGLLLPRTSTVTRLTIPSIKGMLVFDTLTNSVWMGDGSQWTEFSGSGGAAWLLNGNTGTSPLQFVGTLDDKPLHFRINNTPAGQLHSNNIFYGLNTGLVNTTGGGNAGIGAGSLSSNTTGNSNTALGHYALQYNTDGYQNTATGSFSLNANTTGYLNTAAGAGSLQTNTTGHRNAAFGYGALSTNEDGRDNSATGMYALYYNSNGNENTANGFYALYANNGGSANTAIGAASMQNTAANASFNTAVGANTFLNNGGSNNTAVGYNADVASPAITNATAIGNGAMVGVSNRIRLGNVLVTSVESWGSFNSLSDARFKTNVEENVKGLEFILKLRPVTYTIDSKKFASFETAQMPEEMRTKRLQAFEKENSNQKAIVRSGFLAQEVAAITKQIGFDFDGITIPQNPSTGTYSIAYGNFTVPLVKAVQEQQKMIDTLKNKNEVLEKELQAIKAKLGM